MFFSGKYWLLEIITRLMRISGSHSCCWGSGCQ